jgi:cytochrome c peroxidase
MTFALLLRRPLAGLLSGLLALPLAGCGGGGSGPSQPQASAAALVGARIFADTTLSASGRQSCQTCHDFASGLAAPNALAVQPGGVDMALTGVRNTPSVSYMRSETAFRIDPEDGPQGGFFWDGRKDTLAGQATEPFTNPREMANVDHASVVARLRNARYAAEFKAVYGADVFDDVETAFTRMTEAVAAFETEDTRFEAFTSKFDEVQRGAATFTAAEARGFALFQDETKGNCSACHPSEVGEFGALPIFTDRTYDNLGVPRNAEIPANADPAYYDLGLCNNAAIQASDPQLCGAFKVPSLRNVALRHSFFHNGRFHTLKEALTFYVQRDTNPDKFYPLKADGSVDKFDDLPLKYRANVNQDEVPYNRRPGDAPALSDAEIDDVIAFLGTRSPGLHDGRELREHLVDHLVEAEARLPAPVARSLAVVDRTRPVGGDGLAEIGHAVHREIRDAPGDCIGDLPRREADGRQVVAPALVDRVGRGLHQFDGGAQRVVHQHHRQRLVFLQEAGVAAVAQRRMEDLDGVVRGAAARGRLPADEARVAQAAHVHAVVGVVPGAPALAGQLADAVDRGGIHDRVLRRGVGRRGRAEGGDRARPEHLVQLGRARELEDVEQARHIQVPGPLRMLLAVGRQGRGQQVDLRDLVALDDGGQPGGIGHVELLVRQARIAPGRRDVAGDDLRHAWALGQCAGQFGADLAVGADDEDARSARPVDHAAAPTRPSSRPACEKASTAFSR